MKQKPRQQQNPLLFMNSDRNNMLLWCPYRLISGCVLLLCSCTLPLGRRHNDRSSKMFGARVYVWERRRARSAYEYAWRARYLFADR